MYGLARIEVPKRRTCFRIHSLKCLRIVAEKDQAPSGSHRSGPGSRCAYLRVSPRELVRCRIVSQKDFLTVFAGGMLDARRVKVPPWSELLRLEKVHLAILMSHEIEETRRRIVRRRVPVCRTSHIRAHERSVRRRLNPGSDWPAGLVNSLRLIQFLYELGCRQELPISPIENVDETVAIRFEQ